MHRVHTPHTPAREGPRPEDQRPEGLLPGLPLPVVAARPSQRGPLAEAGGRRLAVERANAIAQLGAVLLCAAVLVAIALQGCS